jgi:hypothetical protein
MFSLSTPCIEYDDTRYLGVGHAKINHADVLKFPMLKNKLDELKTNKITTIEHPHYTYFLYFYTFNKDSFEIDSISKLITFDNPNEPFLVYFPSGLEKACDNTYIVSYGVGDVMTKLWFLEKTEIDQLLMRIVTQTNTSGNTVMQNSGTVTHMLNKDTTDLHNHILNIQVVDNKIPSYNIINNISVVDHPMDVYGGHNKKTQNKDKQKIAKRK